MLVGALAFLTWLFVFNLFFLVLQVISARALGFLHGEAVLGFGPQLSRLVLGPFDFRLKLLPFTGYVRMPHLSEEGREGLPVSQRRFAAELALTLAPWLAFLLAAACVVGPDGVFASAKGTWAQVLSGVYPEFGGGAPLLRRATERLVDAPIETLASLSVKCTIFNLLPWPSLAGGRALMLLLRFSTRLANQLAVVSMLLLAPFWIGWAYSLYRFVSGG